MAPSTPAATSTILIASFDKSVLQISDWLTLERDMIKSQRVLIGDIDAIIVAIEKQKVKYFHKQIINQKCKLNLFLLFFDSP